jgi:hypothetical protein
LVWTIRNWVTMSEALGITTPNVQVPGYAVVLGLAGDGTTCKVRSSGKERLERRRNLGTPHLTCPSISFGH